MSWLFGIGKKDEIPQFPVPPQGGPGGDGPSGGGGGGDDGRNRDSSGFPSSGGSSGGGGGIFGRAGGKAMEAYRFDSAALERAAQAAKELEKSRKSVDFVERKVAVTQIDGR